MKHRAALKTRYPWSQEDDAALALFIRDGASAGEMSRALQRTASSIYKRAVFLGLGVGCLAGTELLHTSARRTGFAPKTLARIIRWAGVPAEKSFSRGKSKGCYLVEDVDDAVERWLKTETVNAAAARLGIATSTLLRWLREEGILGAGRLVRSSYRVASGTIERVVRERRS